MLIVPIENRPDWNNPPLATLLLIIINVLVFFAYQSGDSRREAQSYRWYAESGLAAREQQAFVGYTLHAQGAAPQDSGAAKEASSDAAPEQFPQLTQFEHAAFDRAFVRELHRELDGDQVWRDKRSRFEALVNTISSQGYAFNPGDPRPLTWITSMFLHGSFMHLLGNMVFLFLFGFALEIAVGRGIFVLLYLCSGLGGTLLYWASELGTDHGALGASGAISGLMGMYIALYGLKKIRFFYNVIFFTGQFSAPALIVFPVWVGYELLGARDGNDGVGHWAHTGGLLFGFVLLALWMRFGLKVNRDYIEKIDHDAPFRSTLARIQEQVVSMQLDAARAAAEQLVKAHPRDERAWRAWYGVVKIAPSSRDYHRAVHSLFKQLGQCSRESALHSLIEEVAHDYIRIGGDMPALTESVSLLLAQRLGRVEHVKVLDVVAGRLLASQCRHEAMPSILQAASNLSARAALTIQAQHFRAQLQARFPDSPEARQLAAHLPA